MNISNITQLPTLLSTNQSIDLTLLYILIGAHVILTIIITILSELVKYHVLSPQQTNRIIKELKSVMMTIPLNIVQDDSV